MERSDFDVAQAGYAGAFWQLTKPLPGGLLDRIGAAQMTLTGAPMAFFNSIFVTEPRAAEADVAMAVEKVTETGLPFCVRLARGRDDHLVPLVNGMGLDVREERATPAMVLRPLASVAAGSGLEIRTGAAVYEDHLAVVASGFGMPVDLVASFMDPAMTDGHGITFHVAYIDDRPAATALDVVVGDVVAIFSVATLGRYRGRGLGGALTERSIQSGIEQGATAATLQSSAMGHPLYERLGFRTVVEYDMWSAGGE